MSRASTAKPPALAMPSRRAAVSAGFPVRRRRPDAGDCRHQGEYAGACPFWTGSLFLCLFSFFLLPKGRDLPKHGLRGGLFRIRAGRQGRGRGPEGARRQDAPLRGDPCRMVSARTVARPGERGAMPCGAEGCRTARAAPCGAGSRMRRRERRYSPSFCGWTGNAVRLTPGGTAIAAWGDRLAVRCRPAVVCRWRSDWEDISIFHALMGAARGRRRGVCPG